MSQKTGLDAFCRTGADGAAAFYLRIDQGDPGSKNRSGFFVSSGSGHRLAHYAPWQPAAQLRRLNSERRSEEVNVYLYWRVQQDLNCLGEALHFHDPALIRSLRRWIRKNFTGLTMAGDHLETSAGWFSRN